MNPIGLYMHVPFCLRKCGYCDFYSVCDLSYAEEYAQRLCRQLDELEIQADTVYIGGGTPSLLGGKRLSGILRHAERLMTPNCEITVEVNPGDALDELVPELADSGVNRLSIGMQSHNDAVLSRLTRRHTASDVEKAVCIAQQNGIRNFSLDVMLGVEGLTVPILSDTLAFCRDAGATHVSAYMLKLEEGTPFAAARERMALPDDEETADQYLMTCETLERYGFAQYEISNFAQPGRRSRHNMKYWNDEEYIGLGPAAHSYYKGKRFSYPRDLRRYLNGVQPIPEGEGGGFEEYAMLRLRLTDGLRYEDARQRYPDCGDALNRMRQAAEVFAQAGFLTADGDKIAMNPKGFLVSNSIISEILYRSEKG